MRKRIRKVLIDAALVSGLVLFGHECGDEVLFKTEEEKNLEDKLEMPINLDWELRGEERSVRIRQLESYLDIASENWDLYSQQFSNINYISITSDISLFNPVLGSLHYFCSEKQSFCYSDQDIVHELGHLWYFSLSTVERSRFEHGGAALAEINRLGPQLAGVDIGSRVREDIEDLLEGRGFLSDVLQAAQFFAVAHQRIEIVIPARALLPFGANEDTYLKDIVDAIRGFAS